MVVTNLIYILKNHLRINCINILSFQNFDIMTKGILDIPIKYRS